MEAAKILQIEEYLERNQNNCLVDKDKELQLEELLPESQKYFCLMNLCLI